MMLSDIDKTYKSVCNNIAQKQIKNAFDNLNKLIEKTSSGEFKDRLHNLEGTYENLLRYTIDGIQDPERKNIYNHLLVSTLKLADQVKEDIYYQTPGLHTYSLKKELEKQQSLNGKILAEKLEDLGFKQDLDEVLEQAELHKTPRESFESQKHTEIISKAFKHLWLSNDFKAAEQSLIKTLQDTDKFFWYERSLTVSAISLSLLRHFDISKFNALFGFYKLKEDEVWQRALIGLLLGFYKYNKRLEYYPDLLKIIYELAESDDIEKNLELILIQFIRSGETEKLSKKIREEIVPEMTKLVPKLKDKLELDKLIPDDFLEEKNPDWGKIFEDSEGLYEKVEEFSKLQLEGADVFMSAFSQLKQFPFFNEMSNWFMPFHPENPAIDNAFNSDDAEFDKNLFIKGMQQTAYMCNSDKYSFCLNVQMMPEAQKSMLLKLFQAELEGMEEMNKEDSILDYSKKTRSSYTQYIHDLYRFYKLFSFNTEFYDIFKTEMDFYNCTFFKLLVKDDKLTRNIAEYYFQNQHFEKAIDLFGRINNKKKETELIEKIAYSYQMLGNYKKALRFYKEAEIFDAKKEWTLKKIGLCYRKLKKPKKALEYYKRAEFIKPDNLYTQATIGHCYLDLKNFDEALKYYFKVEYLDPKNTRVYRPIAWCCFVEGKFDKAAKYYNKILEQKPNAYDYLNMGHLQWCKGDKTKTVEYYKENINFKGNTLEKFLLSFELDKPYLLKHGINPDDIPILLDHLQYQLKP